MTANSHEALVAGAIFGAVLILLAQGLMWLVRSEWSERRARKAERIVTETPLQARARVAAADWAAISRAIEAETAPMRDALDRVELASVAPVIHMQRKGGAS